MQSIRLAKRLLAKKMDARVKPAHDESNCRRYESEDVMEAMRIIAVDGDSNFIDPLGQGFIRQNAGERILEHRRAGQPAFKAARRRPRDCKRSDPRPTPSRDSGFCQGWRGG
jgi:hypothetical protein